MNRLLPREVVIVGAGPAGIICALECSKRIPTTLLVRQLPSQQSAPRVDSVPASLLALLVDFGIHPQHLEVTTLHKSRRVAWDSPLHNELPTPASAHIERPLLENALLNLAAASGRVKIVSFTPEVLAEVSRAAAMNQIHLVDASGRNSISAKSIVKPARTWAARTFLAAKETCSADPEMRIAALPDGFVYRLGSSRNIAVGTVGRGAAVAGVPSDIERYLRQHGAGWLLEDLPPLAELNPGRTSTASVQWPARSAGLRVGDAAMARDPLSGQGLAAAISDSLYAASALCHEDAFPLLQARQAEQKQAHLLSLVQSIDACRFRHEPIWSDYSEFLNQHLDASPRAESKVVLREGRLAIDTDRSRDIFSASTSEDNLHPETTLR